MDNNRPMLLIPGPIECHQDVLDINAHYSLSHVDPRFIEIMGESLELCREVFLAPDSQPFILSASGSIGWDFISVNCIEKGDRALVLNIGYFGDRWAECLELYGANVDQIKCSPGDVTSIDELKTALQQSVDENKPYKLVTITHVDTSTGCRSPLQEFAEVIRNIIPDVLIASDGVCAGAAEELRMTEWDIDCYMTASQKALGVPPGLSVVMFRPRALEVVENRKTQIASYYSNLNHWLPIMNNYEARKPSYFATPAVNLIMSLHVSLRQIVDETMEKVFNDHNTSASLFRSALEAIGLDIVPSSPDHSANTMTAIKFPEGITKEQLLPKIKENGMICAGGLHKEIKTKYFRVGHMGLVTRGTTIGIKTAMKAIEAGLTECGYNFPTTNHAGSDIIANSSKL
eukprot:TRINITY_DN1044_c3_g1_i1.p1 TRINITY_DN1044_c3_g1~~TRINITY_DN1044_c3_g1_i1.p1  ORF type:complete len:402 (+),score=165.40 TRINITY_DN1044_c3_g1_i1:72-1277(+)